MSLEVYTRRYFLKMLIAGATGVASYTKPGFAAARNIATDTLSFADQNGMGPDLSSPDMGADFLPLHKETILPTYRISRGDEHSTAALLKNMFLQEGRRWKSSYRIQWTYQHYGVCGKSHHCNNLLRYCVSAKDYLYENISHLLDADIRWKLLATSDNIPASDSAGFQGYVGKYTYLVYRVSAMDDQGQLLEPYLVNAAPVDRAINFIDSHDNTPYGCLLYVIPGATSLMSPFSELVHLSTHEPSLRYAGELTSIHNRTKAKEISTIAGETVTEAAATVIAKDYLHQSGQSHRLPIIKSHSRNLNSRLPLIANAIHFMQRRGVQQALDIYLDKPSYFMQQLSS